MITLVFGYHTGEEKIRPWKRGSKIIDSKEKYRKATFRRIASQSCAGWGTIKFQSAFGDPKKARSGEFRKTASYFVVREGKLSKVHRITI